MHAVFSLQAHVLSLMTWADGQASPDERRTFNEFLSSAPGGESQISELLRLIDEPPREEDVMGMIQEAPAPIAITVLKMAYILALSDGVFDETERALLIRLISAIGVNKDSLEVFFEMLELSRRAYTLEQSLLSSLPGESSHGG